MDYKIKLSTIPPIEIDSFSITSGKHNIVFANCSRGILKVNLKESVPPDFNPVIIVKDKSGKTLNIQSLGDEVKYISGIYNAEVLTLPITIINNIDIEADNSTIINFDNPGILNIQKNIRGFGIIYQLVNGNQIKVISINENSSRSESLYLQPGDYRIVFRPLNSSQSVFTQFEDFKITSGKTTKIKL